MKVLECWAHLGGQTQGPKRPHEHLDPTPPWFLESGIRFVLSLLTRTLDPHLYAVFGAPNNAGTTADTSHGQPRSRLLEGHSDSYGCFHKRGALFVDVPIIRDLLFGLCIRAADF